MTMTGLALALLLSAAPASEASVPKTLAAELFAQLGVQVVSCPAYTIDGGNRPVCGRTHLTAEAFARAFDGVRGGDLEPLGPWREDHGVWLRRYRGGAHLYAAVYTPLAGVSNVQLVRLK
jgi:hypothetical protein